MIRKLAFLAILWTSLSLFVAAQDTLPPDTYQRALGFLSENLIDQKVFNLHIQPHWFADSSGLWYMQSAPEGKTFTQVSFPGLEKTKLFDQQRLADALAVVLEEEVDPKDLPLQDIERGAQGHLILRLRGQLFDLDPESYTLHEIESEEEYRSQIPSHDSSWVAFSRDDNLYVRSTKTGEEKALSTNGRPGYEYASWYGWGDIMEGEGGKRPDHFGLQWSPDDAWIYANVCDLRSARKMYLLDWSVDTLYRPRLLSYYRGSPGDTGMVYMEPVFFHVASGRMVRPDLPRSTHINSIGVQWSDTPGVVYLHERKRGYKTVNLYRFLLQSGELETLYSESSPTNIDNLDTELAEESGYMFLLSERSGWRQLYRLDLDTKTLLPLTKGEYYINGIERIDEANRTVYFRASGKEAGVNPYQQYLYRVGFDGGEVERLTGEDAHHAVDLSPDGKYFVDNRSTVSSPTRTVLCDLATGQELLELGRADIAGLDVWEAPLTFSVMADDEETPLYGAMWRPTDFDPDRKYPIIENSYTGPHTQVFPTQFRQAFSNQALAELGFVVIRIDGRGSSNRSKAFHDYSYKNLGGGLADHVHVMRRLAENFSWLDTSRVGIFGHSAGGYDAAHALLAYPDFYKVGVASSADHDHRMEKAWWPEMYMGWPVDSAYHEQSNITMAENLRGKLLITHGGIDENVNPSATFKLAEALVQADKEFDMKIFPSQRHGYRGAVSDYFRKLRWNYFVEHLLGVEPRWDLEEAESMEP